MSEADLSVDYANRKYIEGADDFPPKWDAAAQAFRDRMTADGRCELDIAYGSHARERFDLFLPEGAPKGLVVFVHGGYWRTFDKSCWSHFSQGALDQGYAVAMPGYVLCPEVRISDITRQVAAAIKLAADRVPGPIYLMGHSAGGHLASRMLCADIGLGCADRIKRVVSISGVHDLRPLLQTDINADLHLDAGQAAAESPVLHADHLPVPLVAWVGGAELPAFIDQSRWLVRDWQNATLHIDEGKHHFDVIDGLEDADSPLMMALLG